MKKIFFLLLLVSGFASAQTIDTSGLTNQTAKGYKYKTLYIAKYLARQAIFTDSVNFKGYTYLNFNPTAHDSTKRVATTLYVDRAVGAGTHTYYYKTPLYIDGDTVKIDTTGLGGGGGGSSSGFQDVLSNDPVLTSDNYIDDNSASAHGLFFGQNTRFNYFYVGTDLMEVSGGSSTLSVGTNLALGSTNDVNITADTTDVTGKVKLRGLSAMTATTDSMVVRDVGGTLGVRVMPWSTKGNAGTSPAAAQNFIGTTDNNGLRFKINNYGSGLLSNNGVTLFGYGAGGDNPFSIPTDNTGFGYLALTNLGLGDGSTAIGHQSMRMTTDGDFNTAVGFKSLRANTTGSGNVAIGYRALDSATDAIGNTAIGYAALIAPQTYATGSANTAVGYLALSPTTANDNTAVGYYALKSNVTGQQNVAVGSGALRDNVSGSWNTVGGVTSLQASTGSSNTAFGNSIMQASSSGSNNAAFGANAMQVNSSGANNVAIGYNSLLSNTTGSSNIAIGSLAGKYNTTVSNQIFINSLDRSNYAGDTAQSPIYILENATTSAQRLRLNSKIYASQIPAGAGDKAVRWNSTTKEFTYADTTAGGGGSTSPAGNYGNLQINRNGAFDTPGGDSLDFDNSTGLVVKNKGYFYGNVGIGTAPTGNALTVAGSTEITGNYYQAGFPVKPYTILRQLITQTSTNAPVVVSNGGSDLENTTGDTYTWSYVNPGEYLLTATGTPFTTDKTSVIFSLGSSLSATRIFCYYQIVDNSNIKFFTVSNVGVVDDVLDHATVNIMIDP